jgi:hypothetical protein
VNSELRFEEVMQRIDVYGRLAFGGQCVAAMAMIAGPTLFVTASVLAFTVDERGAMLFYWLGGWATAVGLVAGGIVLGVFCWRWSGDWITEWPGYAVGFAIAAAANGALAWMLTSTPVPIPASIAITAGGAFAIGCIVAGNLAGTRVLIEQREQRTPSRTIARRR